MATVARFGSDGFIRKQQELEQQITAFSLTLLTNIVMAWNTVYIQEILGDAKSKNSKRKDMMRAANRLIRKTLTIFHLHLLNTLTAWANTTLKMKLNLNKMDYEL